MFARIENGEIVELATSEELASEEKLEDLCNWSGRSRCSGAVGFWTRSDGVSWPLCEVHTGERERLERRLVREYGGQS